MFHEMSIRIGGYLGPGNIEEMGVDASTIMSCDMLTDVPLKLIESDPIAISRVKDCIFQAIMDGYSHIVYNFIRNGSTQLTDRDICNFKGFDIENLWNEYSTAKNSQNQSF